MSMQVIACSESSTIINIRVHRAPRTIQCWCFGDVISWSSVADSSGKKPWITKIGAELAELCACQDA